MKELLIRLQEAKARGFSKFSPAQIISVPIPGGSSCLLPTIPSVLLKQKGVKTRISSTNQGRDKGFLDLLIPTGKQKEPDRCGALLALSLEDPDKAILNVSTSLPADQLPKIHSHWAATFIDGPFSTR